MILIHISEMSNMLGGILYIPGPFHTFFLEVLVLGFFPVLTVAYLFLIDCGSSLYILDVGPLLDTCIWNTFSQSVVCLFTFFLVRLVDGSFSSC